MISPLFVVSSLAVIVTPGPDLALVTHLTLHRRRRVALGAAVGMIAAGAAQAAVGALGLAAVLEANPRLFAVARWLGAAVLLWWAVASFRSGLRAHHETGRSLRDGSLSTRRAFWAGAACTGTNPKVGLFLIAFLPQFVPSGSDFGQAVFVLAGVYLAMALAWLVVWIHLVDVLRRNLLTPAGVRMTDMLVGVVLTGLAARLALT